MFNSTSLPFLPFSHEGKLVEVHSGGISDWKPVDKIKKYTNAFIKQDGKILLGYKKRGFGSDMYNGFGGKVDSGEPFAQAAVRELREEAGIEAPLRRCGTLYFVLDGVEEVFHIELFVAEKYTGTITESDEMRPQWFATDKSSESQELLPIPYAKMWADDIYWMPMLLEDRVFVGRADFTAVGKMTKWWFAEQVVV